MRRYQNNKLFGFHKLQGLANGDDARLEELFNKMQSRGYTAVALAELTKTSTAPSPFPTGVSFIADTYPIVVYSPTDPLARAMLYIPEKYAAVVFKGLVCRHCHFQGRQRRCSGTPPKMACDLALNTQWPSSSGPLVCTKPSFMTVLPS